MEGLIEELPQKIMCTQIEVRVKLVAAPMSLMVISLKPMVS